MANVKARGIDYSATEFSPAELNGYSGGFNPQFLGRYIGYPSNTKCISHYPGAYAQHRDSGRPVILFHQIEYRDFEGGFNKGVQHAQTALADAKSVGWNGETPIIACFDRRMGAFTRNGVYYREIPISEVRDYVKGFVSVIGHENAGFYGFEDTMGPCITENWVKFTIQCGARSAQIPGVDAWQENNYQPYFLRASTDVLELYIGLDELGGDTVTPEEMRTIASLVLDTDVGGSATLADMVRANTNLRDPKTGEIWPIDARVLNIQLDDKGTTLASRAVQGAVADIDEDALAEALANRGIGGASPAQVKAAVADVINATRLSVGS